MCVRVTVRTIALVVVLTVAGCGSDSSQVDPAHTAQVLTGQLRTYAALYGPEVKVSCPARVPAEEGRQFTCTVIAYSHAYPARLVVTDTTSDSYRWGFVDNTAPWTSFGPAHLTCGDLRQDDGWNGAGLQKARMMELEDPKMTEAELARYVGRAYRKVCEGARSGYHPSDEALAETGP